LLNENDNIIANESMHEDDILNVFRYITLSIKVLLRLAQKAKAESYKKTCNN